MAGAAGEPAVYLDVLLTDCSAFDEALTYLEGLPRAAAADALKKYGKVRRVTPSLCAQARASDTAALGDRNEQHVRSPTRRLPELSSGEPSATQSYSPTASLFAR